MRAARFRSLQICIPRYLSSTLAFVCHLLRDRFDSVLHGGGGGRPTQFPPRRRRGRALDERVLSLRRNTTQNKNQEVQLDDKGESQKRAETDSFIRLIYSSLRLRPRHSPCNVSPRVIIAFKSSAHRRRDNIWMSVCVGPKREVKNKCFGMRERERDVRGCM